MSTVLPERDRFKDRMIRRSTSMAEAYRSYAHKGLSKEACDVFDLMGRGMRLLVARKGKDIKLIPDPKLLKFTNWTLPRGQVEVSEGAYLELQVKGVITELTKYTTGSRGGWLEMELPGEKYKVFICTQ